MRAAGRETGVVENATDLLIDAADGLRVVNEVEQLAAFEWAACQTSDGVRRLLTGLQPGMTEREAVRLLGWNGAPLSCHLMLTAGDRARLGLLSPSDREIERGDPLTVAFGIWGRSPAARLRRRGRCGAAREYRRLRRPPGRAVRHRRRGVVRALHVGPVAAPSCSRSSTGTSGTGSSGSSLNPGHQLHLDEWVNSPVRTRLDGAAALRHGLAGRHHPGDRDRLLHHEHRGRAGAGRRRHREELADRFPDAWQRITARRAFMHEALGIDLHPGRAAVLQHPRRTCRRSCCGQTSS
jgi:hypothetical protein